MKILTFLKQKFCRHSFRNFGYTFNDLKLSDSGKECPKCGYGHEEMKKMAKEYSRILGEEIDKVRDKRMQLLRLQEAAYLGTHTIHFSRFGNEPFLKKL